MGCDGAVVPVSEAEDGPCGGGVAKIVSDGLILIVALVVPRVVNAVL